VFTAWEEPERFVMNSRQNKLDRLVDLRDNLTKRMIDSKDYAAAQLARQLASVLDEIEAIESPDESVGAQLTPLSVVQLKKLTHPGTTPDVRAMNKRSLIESGVLTEDAAGLLEYKPGGSRQAG
jgi:hypothetical protein